MQHPNRRLKFTILVLVSQLLLIALAIAWTIHMALVAVYGSVYFIEGNRIILWTEIVSSISIALFGTVVFFIQIRRLGERRRSDDSRGERRALR